MAGTPTIYRGNSAILYIGSSSSLPGGNSKLSHTNLSLSDVSITLDKGVVEQSLVGQAGNYFVAGALSCEGSLTACRIHMTALARLVKFMIDGTTIGVSGQVGSQSLHFCFKSCQITNFDYSIGAADEIVEGSIDFSVMYPYAISAQDTGAYVYLRDMDSLVP